MFFILIYFYEFIKDENVIKMQIKRFFKITFAHNKIHLIIRHFNELIKDIKLPKFNLKFTFKFGIVLYDVE